MKSVTLPAYAKVNLYLNVLGKRPDGYHELVTLFERIDLADRLTLTLLPREGIEIECAHPEVPTDASNLVYRAATAYAQVLHQPLGLRILLEKQIPVAGGLGGGSSDAAATLIGLQRLMGEPLSQAQLMEIGRRLGADVAFFLSQSAWALGTGRGDLIEPLALKTQLWQLLVSPGFPIPTKAVYEAFGSLTSPRPDVRLLLCALRDDHVAELNSFVFNALEPTVENLYPAIVQVKDAMKRIGGLLSPIVSGSGATVMAIATSFAQAQEASRALHAAYPRWQVFVAATKG